MTIMNNSILFAVCCALILLTHYFRTRHNPKRWPLPPGPKPSWFGGFQLPQGCLWLTYARWKDTYGDIIYIYNYGTTTIVMNSVEDANMLLDKRGHKYSSRPNLRIFHELYGRGWLFAQMEYGSRWRRHRTKFRHYFHADQSPFHQPVQVRETHKFLRRLLASPDKFGDHIRRTAGAIILKITYGYTIADEGDAYVALAEAVTKQMANINIFQRYFKLVNYIPILKYAPSWIPGASFNRMAPELRRMNLELRDSQFTIVKESMADGTAVPCIATRELEKWKLSNGNAEEEEIIRNVTAIAFSAGADTTVSAITSFFLAMVLFPDIQTKARDEIDRVVGSRTLPSFADKSSLPYISCIVWECLRWNPVIPTGVPHCVTADDEYKGYRIPKGSTIIANV